MKNYFIVKEELMVNGPVIRFFDNIKIILNYDKNSIEFFFINEYLKDINDIAALELSDSFILIKSVYLNDVKIWNYNDPKNFSLIFAKIEKNIQDKNSLIFFVESKSDLDYESGCVIYKEFLTGDPFVHLNSILDEWGVGEN